jgi:hypothetical protein
MLINCNIVLFGEPRSQQIKHSYHNPKTKYLKPSAATLPKNIKFCFCQHTTQKRKEKKIAVGGKTE